MTNTSRPLYEAVERRLRNMAAGLVQPALFEALRLLIVFEVWSHMKWLLLPRTSHSKQTDVNVSSRPTLTYRYRFLADQHSLDVMVSVKPSCIVVRQRSVASFGIPEFTTSNPVCYCYRCSDSCIARKPFCHAMRSCPGYQGGSRL